MTEWRMSVPVVSTAHITKQDAERLEAAEKLPFCSQPDGFMGACSEGWLFHIRWTAPSDLVRAGFSEAFACLIQFAQSKGETYLRLDSAGDHVKDLPVYDW
jgi:hypothetical protein